MVIDGLVIDGLGFPSDIGKKLLHDPDGELLMVGSHRSQEVVAELRF